MSIKLLANENFPAPAIRKLREAGRDVVAVREAMPSASDKAVMDFARREQRWDITFDRDYGDLIFREGLPPPPVIRGGRGLKHHAAQRKSSQELAPPRYLEDSLPQFFRFMPLFI